jgi:hypothetical protein
MSQVQPSNVDLVANATTPGPAAAQTAEQRPSMRLWEHAQIVLSLIIAVGVFVIIAWMPHWRSETNEGDREPEQRLSDVVEVAGPGRVRVASGSTFERKLQIETVQDKLSTKAALTVNGTVIASQRGTVEEGKDGWQFDSPDLLTAYTDWKKAVSDVALQKQQLTAIRDLSDAEIAKQEKVVERLTKLVAGGSEAVKDLDEAKTVLRKDIIQGKKDIFEGETAVRTAERSESALARQLQQAGLEAAAMPKMTPEDDIVVAEVPEGRASLVHEGSTCEARFFAIPGITFKATVASISPVVSRDRRTLKVVFNLMDPNDLLRPGMFAEIGLGTDARDELLVPSDALLHIGRTDYALRDVGAGVWEATEVQVGDLRGTETQILGGLNPGDRVLARGALLLKPVIIRSLQMPAATQPSPASAGARP